MKHSSYLTFRILQETEYPWDLLLEADPSRGQIETYLPGSEVVGVFCEDVIIGVLALFPKGRHAVEIKNVSVTLEHRGRGFGRLLLLDAVKRARTQGYSQIEIGTGNSSLGQLALYQKIGFRIVGIDQDFFIRNYPEPIVENGVRCRDMVRLAMKL